MTLSEAAADSPCTAIKFYSLSSDHLMIIMLKAQLWARIIVSNASYKLYGIARGPSKRGIIEQYYDECHRIGDTWGHGIPNQTLYTHIMIKGIS